MKRSLIFAGMLLAFSAQAELVQQFRDPTFSGNGWTTQVLTLQQMEKAQKEALASQQSAADAAALAAAANTPSAKFMALFTSQMYSQLATQLSNNMFSTCKDANGAAIAGCTPASYTGSIVIDPSTNTTVKWTKLDSTGTPVTSNSQTATQVNLQVNGPGQNTNLTVPIASFAF
jgi:hypothetical protein